MDSINNSSSTTQFQSTHPEELVTIDPLELKFPLELKKQTTCSFQLSNKSDNHVAFKVKTTNPKKYSVRPNNGIVLPRSQSNVTVTMQALRESPPDMQCNDKFLVQCVAAPPGATVKDITPDMFNKEAGNHVEESKLRVSYVHPRRPPSPVREESEEETSENMNVVSKGSSENQITSSKANDLISTLTKEKQSIIQENKRLQAELELLKRSPRKNSSGGLSIYYVLLIALLSILLGYYMRSS
ncbi:vesicle-associated protein 1-2 [Daucus carota subsp. sativus]|uniref:vesicle-associated protein 1-2 n=1 Tax=Daucus carota subsp. sativus TaxID=79200 RepID=UPI0007B2BCFF|nr:PREDICTED: vesicle-associated protein 1-2-like [Daucus carota subsp. sativus]